MVDRLHLKSRLSRNTRRKPKSWDELRYYEGRTATRACDCIQTDGGRDIPAVRNLPIMVTFQGASSSGIPRQGSRSSSKPMDEASSSGKFHRELAIVANMWREGTQN
jgi:hypothetical protein